MDYKQEYEKLLAEFEEYKKQSIKWGVADFMFYEMEDYTITEDQAQKALEEMVHRHDCNDGITWDTLEYYYREYGTKVMYEDLNNEFLESGDVVDVPYPNDTDIHSQEFTGVIASFRGGCAIVEDGDGDCFSIEPNRLTKN